MNNPVPGPPVSPVPPEREQPIGLSLLVGWLVPGAGFWMHGRRARGATQFVLVLVTFGLGLALHSGVAWPSWSPRASDFNLINNFTFIIQLGAGLPALLSLLAQKTAWTFLAGVPQDPFYELGGFYLIVAGAINYFALCNLYDRLLRPQTRFRAQEAGQSEDEPPAKEAEAKP